MKNAGVVKLAGALALALSGFGPASHGVPYATSLINNSGIVSFRLNEAADDVKIIGNGGTLTNDIGPGVVGVTTVDLTGSGMTGGPFQVVVIKVGSGSLTQIGETSVSSIRGVSVNTWPATPAFGRVYASAATGSAASAGVNVYNSDLTAPLTNPRTAGYNWAGASGSKPFHSSVSSDGLVYLTDWSDASGNLIVADPDITSFQYVLNPLSGTAAIPVGSANNHGSVQAVATLGTLAAGNLVVYTVDEDYQQDPTSTTANQMNSLWRYLVGGGPLPYSAAPELLAVPTIGFVSQNDDVAVGPTGLIYFNQRRANSSGPPGTGTFSPSLYIVDPNVYIPYGSYAAVYDPTNQPGQPGCLTLCSNYWKHPSSGGWIWDSQSASTDIGSGGADYMMDMNGISVSPDGRYIAGIWYGSCFLGICPLTNGIPDFYQGFGLATGLISAGRSAAWDAADNVYVASSGSGVVRVYSLGLTTTATTGSDGTFQLVEFKCPADITVTNDPGICGAQVTYASPGGTQTAGLPSGSIFPVGTTVNTFELFVTNTCSFTVTVVDKEPPTITASDLTVPATSGAGAVVNYVATASDNCPAGLILVCAPASGNLFPIGVTTVTCIATDAVGNQATNTFTVTVKGAAEQIVDLITLVQSLSLSPGTANSLLVKLQAAQAALNRGNVNATCGTLRAFIFEVAARAGKKDITQAQADLLIQEATRIRAVLDCR